ncbi:hypothetical protein D3C85_1364190 [compost metagenome]
MAISGQLFTKVTTLEAIELHNPKLAVTVYVPFGAVTVFPETVTPIAGLTV